ncbi:MAG: ACT domain-containing protein [Eubacteriales bacterium]|nr:ACT domain-containing protein [Eubacteriales bacterium]
MKDLERAVVVVVGKDRTGILAEVAGEIAKVRGNVINVDQTVMDGFFTMTMIIDILNMECTVDVLEQSIKEKLEGFNVKVMHENIFDAMHTI